MLTRYAGRYFRNQIYGHCIERNGSEFARMDDGIYEIREMLSVLDKDQDGDLLFVDQDSVFSPDIYSMEVGKANRLLPFSIQKIQHCS